MGRSGLQRATVSTNGRGASALGWRCLACAPPRPAAPPASDGRSAGAAPTCWGAREFATPPPPRSSGPARGPQAGGRQLSSFSRTPPSVAPAGPVRGGSEGNPLPEDGVQVSPLPGPALRRAPPQRRAARAGAAPRPRSLPGVGLGGSPFTEEDPPPGAAAGPRADGRRWGEPPGPAAGPASPVAPPRSPRILVTWFPSAPRDAPCGRA